jgi:hypothetical protein
MFGVFSNLDCRRNSLLRVEKSEIANSENEDAGITVQRA